MLTLLAMNSPILLILKMCYTSHYSYLTFWQGDILKHINTFFADRKEFESLPLGLESKMLTVTPTTCIFNFKSRQKDSNFHTRKRRRLQLRVARQCLHCRDKYYCSSGKHIQNDHLRGICLLMVKTSTQ